MQQDFSELLYNIRKRIFQMLSDSVSAVM